MPIWNYVKCGICNYVCRAAARCAQHPTDAHAKCNEDGVLVSEIETEKPIMMKEPMPLYRPPALDSSDDIKLSEAVAELLSTKKQFKYASDALRTLGYCYDVEYGWVWNKEDKDEGDAAIKKGIFELQAEIKSLKAELVSYKHDMPKYQDLFLQVSQKLGGCDFDMVPFRVQMLKEREQALTGEADQLRVERNDLKRQVESAKASEQRQLEQQQEIAQIHEMRHEMRRQLEQQQTTQGASARAAHETEIEVLKQSLANKERINASLIIQAHQWKKGAKKWRDNHDNVKDNNALLRPDLAERAQLVAALQQTVNTLTEKVTILEHMICTKS